MFNRKRMAKVNLKIRSSTSYNKTLRSDIKDAVTLLFLLCWRWFHRTCYSNKERWLLPLTELTLVFGIKLNLCLSCGNQGCLQDGASLRFVTQWQYFWASTMLMLSVLLIYGRRLNSTVAKSVNCIGKTEWTTSTLQYNVYTHHLQYCNWSPTKK